MGIPSVGVGGYELSFAPFGKVHGVYRDANDHAAFRNRRDFPFEHPCPLGEGARHVIAISHHRADCFVVLGAIPTLANDELPNRDMGCLATRVQKPILRYFFRGNISAKNSPAFGGVVVGLSPPKIYNFKHAFGRRRLHKVSVEPGSRGLPSCVFMAPA